MGARERVQQDGWQEALSQPEKKGQQGGALQAARIGLKGARVGGDSPMEVKFVQGGGDIPTGRGGGETRRRDAGFDDSQASPTWQEDQEEGGPQEPFPEEDQPPEVQEEPEEWALGQQEGRPGNVE